MPRRRSSKLVSKQGTGTAPAGSYCKSVSYEYEQLRRCGARFPTDGSQHSHGALQQLAHEIGKELVHDEALRHHDHECRHRHTPVDQLGLHWVLDAPWLLLRHELHRAALLLDLQQVVHNREVHRDAHVDGVLERVSRLEERRKRTLDRRNKRIGELRIRPKRGHSLVRLDPALRRQLAVNLVLQVECTPLLEEERQRHDDELAHALCAEPSHLLLNCRPHPLDAVRHGGLRDLALVADDMRECPPSQLLHTRHDQLHRELILLDIRVTQLRHVLLRQRSAREEHGGRCRYWLHLGHACWKLDLGGLSTPRCGPAAGKPAKRPAAAGPCVGFGLLHLHLALLSILRLGLLHPRVDACCALEGGNDPVRDCPNVSGLHIPRGDHSVLDR
mmetsp:Transcript_976/g.2625  ORF Transcript_976/g.2625 Transcript_976/m.2625 type:complete len:388 (-) Transcript_976:384-1547(-)